MKTISIFLLLSLSLFAGEADSFTKPHIVNYIQSEIDGWTGAMKKHIPADQKAAFEFQEYLNNLPGTYISKDPACNILITKEEIQSDSDLAHNGLEDSYKFDISIIWTNSWGKKFDIKNDIFNVSQTRFTSGTLNKVFASAKIIRSLFAVDDIAYDDANMILSFKKKALSSIRYSVYETSAFGLLSSKIAEFECMLEKVEAKK